MYELWINKGARLTLNIFYLFYKKGVSDINAKDAKMCSDTWLLGYCFFLRKSNGDITFNFTDPLEKSERNVAAAKASDLEICVQWCIPELDPPELQQGAERDVAQDAMYFVYALNKTAVSSLTSSSSPVVIGKCVVPLAPAQSLHEKLMSTLEIAEADLQPASQPTGATSTSK